MEATFSIEELTDHGGSVRPNRPATLQVPERPDLLSPVVDGGYCVGCGACAATRASSGINMRLDNYGRFKPVGLEDASGGLERARVCPFSDEALSEDVLAVGVLRDCRLRDGRVGRYVASYAGYVREGRFRTEGSSGGLVSWIACELLEQHLVDAVLHVKPNCGATSGPTLFRYGVSRDRAEVTAGAKSRYYPVEMSGVLNHVRAHPGRYAMIGLPCFIKAVRLLASRESVFRDRIKFCVGLFCGHLKSTAFAEMCAWQCGVAPSDLRAIDFRTKIPNRPAGDYAVSVTGERDGQPVHASRRVSDLFGANWGFGLLKYKACDFCDDVVAETADISLGDAWLPEFEADSHGTNVAVVRSALLNSILVQAQREGRVHLQALSAQRVVDSQAAGFRHRREGLPYRLALEDAQGRWRPAKRVAAASAGLSPKLRRIQDLRQELRETSHVAFAQAKQGAGYEHFLNAMRPVIQRYLREYRTPLAHRVLGRCRGVLRFFGGRIGRGGFNSAPPSTLAES
jgi:coenzyme F420 hydrogenase subunit beta